MVRIVIIINWVYGIIVGLMLVFGSVMFMVFSVDCVECQVVQQCQVFDIFFDEVENDVWVLFDFVWLYVIKFLLEMFM